LILKGGVLGEPEGNGGGLLAERAHGGLEGPATDRASAGGMEGVEATAAGTGPERRLGRMLMAEGAGGGEVARAGFHLVEGVAATETLVGLNGHKDADDGEPNVLGQKQGSEAEKDSADDANDGGDKEGKAAAGNEPEERPKDLTAIEGVKGEHIEDEEDNVDGGKREEEIRGGGARRSDSYEIPGRNDGQGEKYHVDEGTCGNGPEHGAGALRGLDVGDAPQRPEEDLVGLAADGFAGESVAELMDENDEEETQVEADVEADGMLEVSEDAPVVASEKDLQSGNEEPAPVDEDVDAKETEEE
jgi:hypothetical protein